MYTSKVLALIESLKTTPGNVVETNVAADPSGFLPDSNCRTFNYIHKI